MTHYINEEKKKKTISPIPLPKVTNCGHPGKSHVWWEDLEQEWAEERLLY